MPVATLINLMGQRATSARLSEDAFLEFRHRYLHRVNGLADKWDDCGYDLDVLVNQTFASFYEQAAQFECSSEADPDVIDKKVSKFLFRTMENQVVDLQRWLKTTYRPTKAIHRLFPAPEQETSGQEFPSIRARAKTESDRLKQAKKDNKDEEMRGVIARLNELQRQGSWSIYRPRLADSFSSAEKKLIKASLSHYDVFSGMCEIPETERAVLCAKLKISEENSRTIRSRVIAKIKKFIATIEVPTKMTSEKALKAP